MEIAHVRAETGKQAGDWTEQSARVSGLTGFATTVATQTPPIKVLGGEEFHVTSRHDILSGLELLSGLRVYFSLEVVG